MAATQTSIDTGDVIKRLQAIEKIQNEHIFEREDVARAITLCLIVRAHFLLCGPPGIAKTTQVRLVGRHLQDGVFFYTQLTPFSTVEDLFGPVDIIAYKDGKRRRVSAGMLQEAHVGVIDEVYNGNEAALKSLLAPMSEGAYAEHGQFQPIPLRTLMGTTNAFPTPEERREKGLAGFHDRWLFRFVARELQSDANFMRMLWTPDIDFQRYEPDPATTVSVAELDHLAAEAARVRVPVAITDELVRLRKAMQAERLYCSPRRWKLIYRALQASALLDGRADVTEDDFALLRHALWDDPDDIPRLERILEEYITSVRDRVAIKFSRILEICGDFRDQSKANPNPTDVSKLALEARARLESRIEEMKQLRRRSRTEVDQLAVDQYLQKAYDYLEELDRAAGL